MRTSSAILLSLCLCAATAHAQGFKFSNDPDAQADAQQKAQREAVVNAQLSTPCRNQIRNRKIMVVIAEERNGRLITQQSGFSRHVEAINTRLEALGLKTYTPAQIKAQVAQAEIDAYFKNDADAALSASRRLAAQYVLKGLIASEASRNAIVKVNEVRIRMDFKLTDASGRLVSTAGARNESYAGADVAGMALDLIDERADEVVAQLYSDYCQRAK